ncbi:MAG: hypothetical protein MHM6MM_003607 [Cercozoa sp. M6MM]
MSQSEHSAAQLSANVRKILDLIPRIGGVDNIDAAIDDPTGYGKGLAVPVAVPIAKAVLILLSLLLFCLFRVCCNCCCGGRKPRKGGYTAAQRTRALVGLFAFALISAAFAIVGYVGNTQFSKGIRGNEGLVKGSLRVVDSSVDFLDLVYQPVNFIGTNAVAIIDRADIALEGTSFVENGTSEIISLLAQLETNFANVTFTDGNYTFECDFCTQISTQAASMRTQVQSQADSVLADMAEIRSTVGSELVAVRDDIAGSVGDAKTAILDAKVEVNAARGDVEDVGHDVEEYDKMRYVGFTILFVLPLAAAFVLGGFGVLLKRSWPFWLNFILGGIAAVRSSSAVPMMKRFGHTHVHVQILVWLLLAVHLPTAMVMSDGCTYISIKESNLRSVLDGQAGDVAQACLDDTPLVAALNLTNELDFREALVFPSLPNISSAFSFSELSNFQSQVHALDVQREFGGPVDQALYYLGNLTVAKDATPAFVPTRTNLGDLNVRNNLRILNSLIVQRCNCTEEDCVFQATDYYPSNMTHQSM